jgi:hypothetical protein
LLRFNANKNELPSTPGPLTLRTRLESSCLLQQQTMTLFQKIQSTISDQVLNDNQKAKEVICAIGLWIEEISLDVSTEDKTIIVEAVLDQADPHEPEQAMSLIQDFVDDLSSWIDYICSPSNNFHGELNDEIKESKYLLSKARLYLKNQETDA